ncbi:MAG: hypothetical protein IH947_03495 [Bacteroidetes bacterium]|nr:hypothetical protein [Bacteroidota bacterium]
MKPEIWPSGRNTNNSPFGAPTLSPITIWYGDSIRSAGGAGQYKNHSCLTAVRAGTAFYLICGLYGQTLNSEAA